MSTHKALQAVISRYEGNIAREERQRRDCLDRGDLRRAQLHAEKRDDWTRRLTEITERHNGQQQTENAGMAIQTEMFLIDRSAA